MRRPPRPRVVSAPAPLPDPDANIITGGEADEIMGRYLEQRRWSAEAAEVFGLCVVVTRRGLGVRHPFRTGGQLRWWQDRVTSPDGTRWLAPPGSGHRMPHSLDLQRSLENAPTCDGWPVIVAVEGPADVISMWHTAPSACVVGLPGTAGVDRWAPVFTEALVLIVTDADDAGDRAADELAPAIAHHGGRSIRIRPPDGMDVTDWRIDVGDDALADAIIQAADVPWWTPAAAAAA